MAKKSLIVYSSITGNTEKLTTKFKQVFEKKGWECDTLKVDKYTDRNNLPVYAEDYDFICVGSPLVAGLPTKEIFRRDQTGIIGPLMRQKSPYQQSGRGSGGGNNVDQGYGPKKGMVFITYSGQSRGPSEALAALSLLALRLEDSRIKCVGKFCCPESYWDEHAVDRFAAAKGWMTEQAVVTLQLYKEDPNHPEFTNLSEEDRKLYSEAVAEMKELKTSLEHGFRGWHWDIQHRPNERDLLKAEIFMEEILEDYYEDYGGGEGGIEAAPVAEFLSIA